MTHTLYPSQIYLFTHIFFVSNHPSPYSSLPPPPYRRNEGPNVANQRLLNVKDNVIPALLNMSLSDGDDWEVARNAALAISIASYELQNHADMANNAFCVEQLIRMCAKKDPEVQTHAAVTIANLCHKDETAQVPL